MSFKKADFIQRVQTGFQKGSDETFGKAKAKRKRKTEAKKSKENEAAAEVKRVDDSKNIDNIAAQNKVLADQISSENSKVSDALARADTDTSKLIKDYELKREDLATQQSALADKQVNDAQKLSKWYEGIATSYEDIGKRYSDAVVGLSQGEEQQMRGTAQADFAAMSAMGAQGMSAQMRGMGPVGGNMMQIMAASSQRAASDSYSSAMGRMENIDQQRREMQFNIVQSSSEDERQNRQMGYNMQAGQFDREFQAADYGIQGQINANNDTFKSGAYGIDSSLNNAYGQADLAKESAKSQYGANIYSDEMAIKQRGGQFEQSQAIDAITQANLEKARQARSGQTGAILGTIGAAVAGYYSGGTATGAGFQAGNAVGREVG